MARIAAATPGLRRKLIPVLEDNKALAGAVTKGSDHIERRSPCEDLQSKADNGEQPLTFR